MAKDLFSQQSLSYARYRPAYPAELFNYIIEFVKIKSCVWDCGTGNGQAALALADYFEKVHATDISQKQLAMAPHTKISDTLPVLPKIHHLQMTPLT